MTEATRNETPSAGLTPDQKAAHEFLTELRTRIALQPLPYQSGVEARALESLWELFALARKAIKDNPGCTVFARDASDMLNVTLRPMTAKWHRAHADGRLDTRDGSDAFRGDLETLRGELLATADHLHRMAYGTPFADAESPGPMQPIDIEACTRPMRFGIEPDHLTDAPTAHAINQDEANDVWLRRAHHGIATPGGEDAIGLALSGGGIRSATFCLGAIQVLAERNLLKDIDFLSTVSGGGYVGSFLSSRLGNGEPQADLAGPHGPDPAPVRYLRQHAKYLSAADLWQAWSMVTATLAGMLLNWTAPLFALAAVALVVAAAPDMLAWPALVLPWLGGLSAAALLAYGTAIRVDGDYTDRWGVALGCALGVTAAAGFAWLVVSGYDVWQFAWSPDGFASWHLLAIVGAVASAMPAVMRFVPILQKPAVQKIVLRVALALAGIVLPLAAVAAFYAFLDLGLRNACWLLAVVLLFGLVSWFGLNINLTGPHRLYRDRLAATFVQPSEQDTDVWPLTELNPGRSAPYHLINTTVNLPASHSERLRDRHSDFFLFSKHWSGAPSTGYQRTGLWRANGQPVDLATAMAVSGAAFSSSMGLASMPTLRALLTFLNVRLGFWIRQPGMGRLWRAPGFSCLMREMTGVGMSEDAAWLNLSDGGHIENMAVYELLRRRSKLIISIDGEADPESAFHGHLTLVRHAQIDFGIRIDSHLDDLRPQGATRFSKTHYMFCRIHYPPRAGETDEEVGLLLYVKLSATGNEAELIKRYRLTHPDFPHQTTLDQFFDEEQFEAYRELGAHVMDGLFSAALTNGQTRPESVRTWFRSLARNLLEPLPG